MFGVAAERRQAAEDGAREKMAGEKCEGAHRCHMKFYSISN